MPTDDALGEDAAAQRVSEYQVRARRLPWYAIVTTSYFTFPTSEHQHDSQSQGFHPDRAADRGRHHRHSCRDRDPEVQQRQAEGLSYAGDLGPEVAADR